MIILSKEQIFKRITMTRPKEFNPDEVVDKAMNTFWQKGFEATSINDLVDSTGINKASLYNTFGNKEKLFHSAIDRYFQRFVTTAVYQMDQESSGLTAITAFLYSAGEMAMNDDIKKGCFLTNSCIESTILDEESKRRVSESLSTMKNSFRRAITRAQESGELSKKWDPDDMAFYLINMMQGLRVLSKVIPDRERLKTVIDITIESLK